MLFIAPKLEAGNKPTDWTPAPEDVNDSIDNISVGSRNIARLGCIIPYDTGTTVSNDNFINSGSCIFSRKALNNSGPIIDHNVIWEQDQPYVISFLMRKLEGTVNNIYFWNDSLKHNDSKIYIDGIYKATLSQQFDINNDTAWHKYEIYFKAKAVTADEASSTGTSKHIIMQPIKQATTAYKMEIKNYKIEKGNKPTDWTPAPEDISDTINNIQIGGRNYVKNTSANWSDWWIVETTDTPTTNRCKTITKLDLKNLNLSANEYISLQIELETSNFVAVSGQTTNLYAQGSVNSTWSGDEHFTNPWNSGFVSIYGIDKFNKVNKFTKTFQITSEIINTMNQYGGLIELGLRCDYASKNAKVRWRYVKIERGNRVTDWSPAPEDTLSQTSEVIVGTQTGTTAAWTGVASFSSLEDNQQITYWLPQTSANNATLNLTLAGGGTTGAKPLYYGGTSRLGTHYPAGSVVHLTYRKNVTIGSTTIAEGWWADANYDSNNYDRIRLNNNIKAKSAITNSRLIVGDSGGYFHLAAGSSFDIDKPILWAGSDIAANGTGSNNYLSMPSCTIRNNTSSGWTATQNLTLYLVGVLSGNKFIVDSTTPFTTNLPTAENSQYYISLGYMISTYQIYLYPEHPIFKYSNGQFRNISQIAYEAFTSEIGGKNIIRRSREFDNTNVSSEETGRLTSASGKATFGAYKTFVTRKIVNSVASDVVAQYRILNVELNEQYAVSFYARGTGQARVYFYGPSNYIQVKSITAMTNANGKIEVNGNPGADGNINITLSNDWKRYWIIYTLKGTYTNNTEVHEKDLLFRCDNKPTEWEICGIKLEKGNKVTDWSPAPEDNDKLISDAATTASAANTNAGTAIQRISSVERTIKNFVKDDTGMVSVTEDGSRNKN